MQNWNTFSPRIRHLVRKPQLLILLKAQVLQNKRSALCNSLHSRYKQLPTQFQIEVLASQKVTCQLLQAARNHGKQEGSLQKELEGELRTALQNSVQPPWSQIQACTATQDSKKGSKELSRMRNWEFGSSICSSRITKSLLISCEISKEKNSKWRLITDRAQGNLGCRVRESGSS
jgi:hypothetical protein